MQITGAFSTYKFEDTHFAQGGAAKLFRGVGPNRDLVYKRYTKPVRPKQERVQIEALVDIGRRVFVAGGSSPGSTPQSSVCWPIDKEEDAGLGVTGVIMPVIPKQFFRSNGSPRTLAHFVHARADPPKASIRVAILIRISEIFAWLAAHDLVHGDFSEANVVWSESPEPAAFLIDADGLQAADAVSPHGMATPNWMDPRVVTSAVPAHDLYSDWYALALCMYRGLLLTPGNLDRKSDGSWPKPGNIPSDFPVELNTLLERTLCNPLDEKGRAKPSEWDGALRKAFLVDPLHYDAPALKKLDASADKNRPAKTKRLPKQTVIAPTAVTTTGQIPVVTIQPATQFVQLPPGNPITVAPSSYNPNFSTLPRRSRTVDDYIGIAKKIGVGALAIVALTAIFGNHGNSSAAQGSSNGSQQSYTSSGSSPGSLGTTYSGSSTGGAASLSPSTALQQQKVSDAAAASQLVGYWVPQLSSKANGTVADGITYDDSSILQNYQSLKSQYGDALLLNSSDYSTFMKNGYWVVVINQGFSSSGEANAWCDQHNIDSDNCFAKKLSHTEGYSGNTVNR